MFTDITSKLELDVMQSAELHEAVELAQQYKMPAMVVHPELAGFASIARGSAQGKFKIIVPVDWPKGDKHGMAKMQGMAIEALSQDGFEILASATGVNSIHSELAAITDFIHKHLSQLHEVRIVLGVFNRTEAQVNAICEAIKGIPTPTIIRTDHNLRLQQSKANTEKQKELIESLHSKVSAPIKISGNINSLNIVRGCTGATRYAVGLRELKNIIRDLKKQEQQRQAELEKARA